MFGELSFKEDVTERQRSPGARMWVTLRHRRTKYSLHIYVMWGKINEDVFYSLRGSAIVFFEAHDF
jgi:hypothetical protein